MNWVDMLIKALIWTGIPIVLLLVFVVVLIVILVLFFYFVVYKKAWKHVSEDFKKQSNEQKGFMDYFRKNKAKVIAKEDNPFTFKDVGGIPEILESLKEINDFLTDPAKYKEIGARIPKGVLIVGPPGTGKTLLAKAIAGEAGVKVFSISGSAFTEMLVGVGSSRVRDLFEEARKNAPCIIFIDEFDALGSKRSPAAFMGEKEYQQAIDQFLAEMDGFENNSGVIIIAATNRPDVLDEAAKRRGRFDRQIKVPRPDKAGREEILRIHFRKVKHDPNFDFEKAAALTPGLVGSDLESFANEAAIIAARKGKKQVEMVDFEEAEDKEMAGLGRNRILSPKEKRLLAYHEAGHTIVAKRSGAPANFHKVTIMAHGEASGLTSLYPEDESGHLCKEEFLKLIATLLGGYAEELIAFGDKTNGARNDIEKVTLLVREMVCSWGMSDEIGPVNYSKSNSLLSMENFGEKSAVCSEAMLLKIDGEVQKIIFGALERAKQILIENRAATDELAKRLIEKETVFNEEVDGILRDYPPQTENKS